MSLLLTDVTVGDRPGRAVHVVDGRIAWLGDAADAPAADRVVAGEGALLTPAFVDAHVHATATGLALTGLDLHSSSSLAETRRRRSPAFAQRSPDGIVLGTGWDETGWPEGRGLTRADLDAVVGDRPAYLARVDVHSATVSTALLDRVPGIADLPGFYARRPAAARRPPRRPAGRLRRDQRRTSGAPRSGPPSTRPRRWASAACTRWPARRSPAPTTSPACSTLAAEQPGPAGARLLGRAGRARRPGRRPRARAWPAPGETCSATAPSARTPPRWAAARTRPAGHRRHPALRDRRSWSHHVRACTLAGDPGRLPRASATPRSPRCIDAVEAVVAELGRPAVRACRHRLEHVEMIDRRRHRADARPGRWSPASSRPSTPPGAGTPACTPSGSASSGPLATNPFADLADAGVALALGSDAPVTPLDPWGGVHAAVDHRTPGSGLRPFDAFDAATHGGWYAARAEHPVGPLAVGAPAAPRPLGDRPTPCPPSWPSARGPTCRLPARRRRTRSETSHDHAASSTRRWWPAPGSWPPGPRSRSSTWPTGTPPSPSSGPCCGWPGSPAPTR